MKIIFNADDFGLTKGITDGIVTSFTDGVVRATTLMMNGNAVAYAVNEAKKHPTLKVGIHLVLTYGKPLHHDVPDLIDANGEFKFVSDYDPNNTPNLVELELEWRTQIEAFIATGLTLDHIDSHHHVHRWEVLTALIVKLAEEYNVPVRSVPSIKEYPHILLTEVMWDGFYEDGVTENVFSDILIAHPQARSVEVMTHPAYVDDELRGVSSYVDKRLDELDILTNLTVPDWAEV